MKIHWPVIIVLCLWVVAARGDGGASPSERAAQKIIQRGRALVRAGHYHEARQVLDGYDWALQDELLRQIDKAKCDKNNALALQLYKIQFGFFPLGAQDDASNEMGKWQKHVLDYARFLSTSSRLEDRHLAGQERRAFEMFRAFEKKRDVSTASQAVAIGRQMATKFPRSVFTVAAVTVIGTLGFWGDDDLITSEAKIRHFFAACLKSMEGGGAPARHRILVLKGIAEAADVDTQLDDARGRAAYSALRQIEKLSDLSSEKADALVGAAKAMMGFNDKNALARSRALFSEVLKKYPRTYGAYQARSGLIENWLAADQPDQALRTIHALEKTTAPSEITQLMLKVAYGLGAEVNKEECRPILEEIARRFPRQSAAAEANIHLAAMYGKRGEETRMVELYLKVASLETKDIDGGNTEGLAEAQSKAIASLAAYYEKHEDWENALKWWRGWKSASFCGNGAESANSANTFRIYNCLMKLGRESEAIQTLEEWTFKPHIETEPQVPVALVEYYQSHSDLSTLEARLREALKKNMFLFAAQMALTYIELIHAKERKDVEALWKPFDHKSYYTLEYLGWKEKYGAKFLIEVGEDAKPFLIEKAKSVSKDERDETSDASSWACLLLARMKAEEVLPILQGKLKHIKNAQELKYRFWALALLDSDQSRALLQTQATSGRGSWQKLARKVLALLPSGQPAAFLSNQKLLLNSGPGLERHWEFTEYLDQD